MPLDIPLRRFNLGAFFGRTVMPFPYLYEPLPHAAAIRLLTLSPGNKLDEINCRLKTVSLADKPKYEALSYLWGSTERDRTLACERRTLKITKSLDVILRRLRYPSEARVLWIDQLCINQDDHQERSEQVQIMREIYRNARLVVLWLGEDEASEAPLARDLIQKLSSQEIKDDGLDHSPWLHFPRDDQLAQLDLPPLTSPLWGAFSRMLKLRYFTRIWIVQEINSAQTALILWGDTQIDLKKFELGIIWATRNNLHFPDPSIHRSSPDLSSMIEFAQAYLLPLPRRWQEILETTQDFEASDPRDKVLALIGLVENSVPFKANYMMSAAEVFAYTAFHTICSTKSLDILSLAQCGAIASIDNVPFWAVRTVFTIPASLTVPLAGPTRGFKACGETSVQWNMSNDWRTLILRGFVLDKVRRATKFSTQNDSERGHEAIIAAFQSVAEDANVCQRYEEALVEHFVWTLLAGSGFGPGDGLVFGTYKGNAVADFIADINNYIFHDWATHGVPICHKDLMELVALALLERPELLANQSGAALTETDENSVDDQIKAFHAKDHEAATRARAMMKMTMQFTNAEMAERFQSVHRPWSQNRAFFITEGGRMGIGSQGMQPTDIICILFGGTTPYVLRPTENRDEFLFVGECYVHGVMSGEEVDGYERGGYTSQWFHLR